MLSCLICKWPWFRSLELKTKTRNEAIPQMLPISVPSCGTYHQLSSPFWDHFELVNFRPTLLAGSLSPFLAWVYSNLGVGVVYPWSFTSNLKQFPVECQPDLSRTAGGECVSRHLAVPWVLWKQWRCVAKRNLRRGSFTACVMQPKQNE